MKHILLGSLQNHYKHHWSEGMKPGSLHNRQLVHAEEGQDLEVRQIHGVEVPHHTFLQVLVVVLHVLEVGRHTLLGEVLHQEEDLLHNP